MQTERGKWRNILRRASFETYVRYSSPTEVNGSLNGKVCECLQLFPASLAVELVIRDDFEWRRWVNFEQICNCTNCGINHPFKSLLASSKCALWVFAGVGKRADWLEKLLYLRIFDVHFCDYSRVLSISTHKRWLECGYDMT